ncbi:MAG TPA: ECF-type sigma factor [Rudaea sp.]|jgi:RNA polymerase sigma factor (TIGR02999 family)|nr:ECF-type sigma factor [Rudaea sp.]
MPSDDAATHAEHDQRADALFAAVYDRLKGMASRQRGRAGDATLDTTALVHELYVKLNNARELTFSSQGQFFDYAAQAMRHILLDHARDRASLKRGGDLARETDSAARELADETAQHTIELDDALCRLEREDARAARVVLLHYFGGLSLPEIAEMTGTAKRTLNRDWRFARAFLYDLLR